MPRKKYFNLACGHTYEDYFNEDPAIGSYVECEFVSTHVDSESPTRQKILQEEYFSKLKTDKGE